MQIKAMFRRERDNNITEQSRTGYRCPDRKNWHKTREKRNEKRNKSICLLTSYRTEGPLTDSARPSDGTADHRSWPAPRCSGSQCVLCWTPSRALHSRMSLIVKASREIASEIGREIGRKRGKEGERLAVATGVINSQLSSSVRKTEQYLLHQPKRTISTRQNTLLRRRWMLKLMPKKSHSG